LRRTGSGFGGGGAGGLGRLRLALLLRLLLVAAGLLAIAALLLRLVLLVLLLLAFLLRLGLAIAALALAALASLALRLAAAGRLAAFAARALVAVAAAFALAGGRGALGLGRGRGRIQRRAKQALEEADHAAANGRGRRRGRCGRRRLRRRFLALLAHRCRARRGHAGHRRGRRDVQLGLGQGVHRQLARGAALVGRLAAFLAQLVLAQAGDLVVRGLQLLVGDDDDRRVVAGLDLAQRAALLVEQEVGDLHRGLDQHLPGVLLHRVLLGDADDGQRQRLDAAHAAVALAARADDLAGLAQAGAQALAAHLQQAEAADAADLDAGAVVLERRLQPLLDRALVLGRGHVDEVDHHQAAQVAQAQLAGHLVGGLQVGLERGLLDVAALGGAGRVDVDR